MQTVLITGCSSGFGLEAARTFLERNWRVVATMRSPDAALLPQSANLEILPLDITDPGSILETVKAAGPIDALINNAGIGFMNVLEGTPLETIGDIFETNTIGTIAMTRAVLPQFRQRNAGSIVNVTSSVTLAPLPLLSVYTASKAAVNAFTESLGLELEPFNIRVRLILPGRSPETRFAENARARMASGFPQPYADFANQILAKRDPAAPYTSSSDVVNALWRAVTDPSSPDRIVVGDDAIALLKAS